MVLYRITTGAGHPPSDCIYYSIGCFYNKECIKKNNKIKWNKNKNKKIKNKKINETKYIQNNFISCITNKHTENVK